MTSDQSMRGGAAAARLAHNQEVVGSNPTPATSSAGLSTTDAPRNPLPRAAGCGARAAHDLASPHPSHPADEAFLRLARAM